MAVDLDGATVTFRDETNDAAIGSPISISVGGGASFTVGVRLHGYTVATKFKLNAGQEAFVGTVPAGHTAGWPAA
jgi:hypothetical protein